MKRDACVQQNTQKVTSNIVMELINVRGHLSYSKLKTEFMSRRNARKRFLDI